MEKQPPTSPTTSRKNTKKDAPAIRDSQRASEELMGDYNTMTNEKQLLEMNEKLKKENEILRIGHNFVLGKIKELESEIREDIAEIEGRGIVDHTCVELFWKHAQELESVIASSIWETETRIKEN